MVKIEKAVEITNAKIQFVSLVDKAANKRTFLLKKAEEGKAEFSAYGRIVKTDKKNHYVTGIVYEPMTEDSQGDYMSEAEITKAAYYFAKNDGKIDIQHSFEPFEGATIVESWVAKSDFRIENEGIRKGSWLMTVEVADGEVWDKIEKGEISGFSMAGIGEYSEKEIELKPNESVEKAGRKISAENKAMLKSIYENLGALISKFDEEAEDAPEKAVNKAAEGDAAKQQGITAAEIQDMIEKAVKRAVEPVLKIKGLPLNLNDSQVRKTEKHYLSGII